MILFKYLLINFVVFLLTGNLFSQGTDNIQTLSNQEIFSKLVEKSLEKLENRIVITGNEKIFSVVINGKDDVKDFLYLKLRQKFHNYKIISETDTALTDYIISFDNIVLKTTYSRIFGSILKDRRVERVIDISFENVIKQKNSNNVLYNEKVSEKSKDDFKLDNLEQIERCDYAFMKSTLPEQSFFEKALIPGAVILASAITIALFFLIRSK